MLWWRSIDSTTATPLVGTDQGVRPFWSPDSAAIGFYDRATKQLKRISIAGGTSTVITEIDPQFQRGQPAAFWSEDDTITFGQPDGLYRVNARGGTPVQVTSSGAMPRGLPDGRFLFLVGRIEANRGLKILGLGWRHRSLSRAWNRTRCLPPGTWSTERRRLSSRVRSTRIVCSTSRARR
jgi:hypothetical protein